MTIERAAKEYLNNFIFKEAKGIVQSGPFKGMVMLDQVSWSDGNLGTKVLGCYEQELHEAIENQVTRLSKLDRPAIILDIGCSEGYYAVGLARLLPDAKITAVDSNKDALRITHEAADANNVSIDHATTELFGPDFNTGYSPDLVICDCEGAEVDYLDPEKMPGLKQATMLVECHDTYDHLVTEPLGKRFGDTHEVFIIFEGSRNPNDFEMLRPMQSLMRWLAVCEGRPAIMHWLFMRPK